MKDQRLKDIKSMYRLNNWQGYFLNDKGKVYYFDLNTNTNDYLFTLRPPHQGREKIIVKEQELYLFRENEQRIYAISLKNKAQKWYYYNKSKERKLTDFDVLEEACVLYYKNDGAKSGYVQIMPIKDRETVEEYYVGQNTRLV